MLPLLTISNSRTIFYWYPSYRELFSARQGDTDANSIQITFISIELYLLIFFYISQLKVQNSDSVLRRIYEEGQWQSKSRHEKYWGHVRRGKRRVIDTMGEISQSCLLCLQGISSYQGFLLCLGLTQREDSSFKLISWSCYWRWHWWLCLLEACDWKVSDLKLTPTNVMGWDPTAVVVFNC